METPIIDNTSIQNIPTKEAVDEAILQKSTNSSTLDMKKSDISQQKLNIDSTQVYNKGLATSGSSPLIEDHVSNGEKTEKDEILFKNTELHNEMETEDLKSLSGPNVASSLQDVQPPSISQPRENREENIPNVEKTVNQNQEQLPDKKNLPPAIPCEAAIDKEIQIPTLAGTQAEMKRLINQQGEVDVISDEETEQQENYEEPVGALYCICRKPYEETDFMIECDQCKEWYHGKCIDIDEEFSKRIDKYFCFRCRRNTNPTEGYCVLKAAKRQKTPSRLGLRSDNHSQIGSDKSGRINFAETSQIAPRTDHRGIFNGDNDQQIGKRDIYTNDSAIDEQLKRQKTEFDKSSRMRQTNIEKMGKCQLATCNKPVCSPDSKFCSDICENYYKTMNQSNFQQPNSNNISQEQQKQKNLAISDQTRIQQAQLITLQNQLQQVRSQHQQYMIAVQQIQNEFQTRTQQRQLLIQRLTQLQQSIQKPGQQQNPAEIQEFQQLQQQAAQFEQVIQQCQARYQQCSQTLQRLQQQNNHILGQIQRLQEFSNVQSAVQIPGNLVLDFRRKAIGAIMQVLNGAVSLSQQIELNLFNRFGQDSQTWKGDVNFQNIQFPFNETDKDIDYNKPLTVYENSENDGKAAYTANITRALIRLLKYSDLRNAVIKEVISPAQFVEMDVTKINIIQQIGNQKREFHNVFSQILGDEIAKKIEEFSYFEIGLNQAELHSKRCSALYQRLMNDPSLIEKIRTEEVKMETLAQIAEQIINANSPKREEFENASKDQLPDSNSINKTTYISSSSSNVVTQSTNLESDNIQKSNDFSNEESSKNDSEITENCQKSNKVDSSETDNIEKIQEHQKTSENSNLLSSDISKISPFPESSDSLPVLSAKNDEKLPNEISISDNKTVSIEQTNERSQII